MSPDESGLHVVNAASGGGDLLYLIRRDRGRWSSAAIAAALSLPHPLCATVSHWGLLLDRLDVAISDVVVAVCLPREGDVKAGVPGDLQS